MKDLNDVNLALQGDLDRALEELRSSLNNMCPTGSRLGYNWDHATQSLVPGKVRLVVNLASSRHDVPTMAHTSRIQVLPHSTYFPYIFKKLSVLYRNSFRHSQMSQDTSPWRYQGGRKNWYALRYLNISGRIIWKHSVTKTQSFPTNTGVSRTSQDPTTTASEIDEKVRQYAPATWWISTRLIRTQLKPRVNVQHGIITVTSVCSAQKVLQNLPRMLQCNACKETTILWKYGQIESITYRLLLIINQWSNGWVDWLSETRK